MLATGEHDAHSLLYVDALTTRELQALQVLATGATNKEIAAQLQLSGHTVKTYVHTIMSKLHAESRTDAIARARALGLVHD